MFNNQTIKGTFIETNYLYCVMCSYELSIIFDEYSLIAQYMN